MPRFTLDELLEEAAGAERPLPDPEGFLAATWDRIRQRAAPAQRFNIPWRSLAALIPLLLALAWFLIPRSEEGSDLAVIENLDVLLNFAEFAPEELETIDLETLEILQNLDLLKRVPVELLENS